MTHEDIQSDLPLYALGSLDAEERQAIERHLADGCDSCTLELRTWREVVGLVPLELPARGAPDLKAELLERVRSEAPRRPVAVAPTAPAPSKVARRRIGWAVPFAAAALALLAIATYREIGWRAERARLDGERQAQLQSIASLQRDLEAARGDMTKVTAALAQRENDVNALRAALAKAEESLAIVQRPGLNLVALKETKDAPPAAGHILLSAPTGKALFYAFDLPKAPPGKAYELWWITEKEGPVPAGLFNPDERGLGRVETTVPTGAGAIQAAAVTVEDAAGVPKPQGPMVLIGQVS
jgi:anti-sigma-K factor RskA